MFQDGSVREMAGMNAAARGVRHQSGCYSGSSLTGSRHQAEEEQNQLENEDQDDGQLEEMAPRDAHLLDREPIHAVEGFELVVHACLPHPDAEAGGGDLKEARGEDVAD